MSKVGTFVSYLLYSRIVIIRCGIKNESHYGFAMSLSGLFLTDGLLSFRLSVRYYECLFQFCS